MSAKAGKRPLRSLTAHEKLSAIRRVHDGESKASVARDIGVPESTLRGWCKNEEKISYLSRQSSPETDDSIEHQNKKMKVSEPDPSMQPFNLSLKTCGSSSGGTYSPSSEHHNSNEVLECDKAPSAPLNLRTKPLETTSNFTPAVTTTPKTTVTTSATPSISEREKERERNRAELARLSAELGLNRPEVFLSTLNNTNNINDLTGLLIQWNNIYQQHMLYQQQKSVSKNKVVATADTSTTSSKLPSPKGLLTTVDKEKTALPISDQPSVYDSVSYWLRQQSLMNNLKNSQNLATPLTCTTSGGSLLTTTSTSSLLNGTSANQMANQHLKFWNWYKQQAPYNPTGQPPTPERPILYQQLTKDKDTQNTENLSIKEEYIEKSLKLNGSTNTNKARSVLDNLLLNNNTIQYENITESKEDTEILSQYEALEHGEKFLRWLEACSDPSVTTLQILTLQTLIKNLRSGADRRNGDLQTKAKVKRK